MPRLIIQNKKPVAHATSAKSSNVSSSLSGNMPLIQSQINLKTNDYINIKNAVKILENYSNHEGWIKLSTEIENNFAVNDIVYVTYTESGTTVGSFDLSNQFPNGPENTLNTFYTGYKVLYVNKYRNEVVINRHFNDITPGSVLKYQYLSKMSCRGGDYFNDVSDGVVYYNCNVGTFGFLWGHVYSGSTTGTTISGATITIGVLGLTTTSDINGYYSFVVPIGKFYVICTAYSYNPSNPLLTYIYTTVTTPLDFHLYKAAPTTTTTTTPTPTTTTTTIAGTTTTTTSGIPGTTTTTTTGAGYNMCATSSPVLSYPPTQSIGLLNVGNLTLGSGSLNNYLIEWKLGSTTGDIVFISGNLTNTDTNKQASHPLINEPIQGGTLYPVLRYIEIDAFKYSPYLSEGGRYSPDLLNCLLPVTIISMNCGNGTSGEYSHSLSYNNSTELPANATRTVRFEIDSNTTSFAWEFNGQFIADRITISYIDPSLPDETLIDWVIGVDATTDYLSTPKKYFGGLLKGVITLNQPYFSGNYLKIQIIPSYYNPLNTNTNWNFKCKCFTTISLLNCELAPNNINQIGDLSLMQMTWNALFCKYILTYQTVGGAGYNDILDCDLAKYIPNVGIWPNSDWSQTQTIDINRNEFGQSTYGRLPGTKIETNGTFTITKTGTNLIYQFNNSTDYTMFVNGYNLTQTDTHWIDYSSDATNINHYKFIVDNQPIELPPFGDTTPSIVVYISYDSIWNFDAILFKITIQLASVTNGFVSSPCSTVYTAVNTEVNNSNNFRSQPDFVKTTKMANPSPLADYYIYATTNNLTTIESQKYILIPNETYTQTTNCLCTPSCSPFIPDWHQVGSTWYFYKQYLKVEITNNSDPINNYQVWNKLLPDGSVDTVWTLIKEISGGVQIVP